MTETHRPMLEELMDGLAEPFDVDRVEWKPQATSGERALAIAYADARAYQDRLNQVAGADWSDSYTVLDGGAVVLCELTACGVTRSDIGEANRGDRNTASSALAQAFKRAAVKFGVGRYLYDLPKTWVNYDPQRKRITPEGERKLRAVLGGARKPQERRGGNGKGNTRGNGNEAAVATPTAFWKLYHEHGKGKIPETQARDWAGEGIWSAAIDKLKAALN